MTLNDFLHRAGPDPVIDLQRDRSCRMARIVVGREHAMEGNVWDFHPDCHGGWHRELAAAHGHFRSPEGMAEALALAVVASGGRAVLERSDYTYGVTG